MAPAMPLPWRTTVASQRDEIEVLGPVEHSHGAKPKISNKRGPGSCQIELVGQ